jgi:hypothetical protein
VRDESRKRSLRMCRPIRGVSPVSGWWMPTRDVQRRDGEQPAHFTHQVVPHARSRQKHLTSRYGK